MKKGITFSPLGPWWPVWCLCVASVEKRHCVHSSMEFRFFFIEESTQCLFSIEATQRHQRHHRGHRGENAMPFSREVTEAPLFFFADVSKELTNNDHSSLWRKFTFMDELTSAKIKRPNCNFSRKSIRVLSTLASLFFVLT